MKKSIGVLAILATLGIATAPFASVEVNAQTTAAPAAAQGACTDDSKAAWGLNRHISSRCGKTFAETSGTKAPIQVTRDEAA